MKLVQILVGILVSGIFENSWQKKKCLSKKMFFVIGFKSTSKNNLWCLTVTEQWEKFVICGVYIWFSSLNSCNALDFVSDDQTKFLNQKETFSENHFHVNFIIYIWSEEIA